MELPIIDTIEIRGTAVQVRAVPLSLAIRLTKAEGNLAEQLAVGADIIARCCTLENGEPIDIDSLTMQDTLKLTQASYGKGADSSDF